MEEPREAEPDVMDTVGEGVIFTSGEWTLERYTPDRIGEWDSFVKESRNGTFILTRPYMDYHSDRFKDFSMMMRRRGRLTALLPANISGDTLRSHQGLTYGGWIVPMRHYDAADTLPMWRCWLEGCRAAGIRMIDYKPVPGIFTRVPAQEDEYVLFRTGGVLAECNLSTAVDLRYPRGLNTLQRRHLRHALALNPVIEETRDCRPFWEMLSMCLSERHEAAPVHTAEELQLLMDRFPDNIRLHEIRLDGKLAAGVCIYDTGVTAHTQYIATTAEGRHCNMLTPLMVHLMDEVYAGRRYFDFGTSNEDHGRVLNEGLVRQKCAYGGSGVVYTRWSIDVGRGLENLVSSGV